MGAGGKRKGAGRPREFKCDPVRLVMLVTPEQAAALDAYGEEHEQPSRSHALRHLLDSLGDECRQCGRPLAPGVGCCDYEA